MAASDSARSAAASNPPAAEPTFAPRACAIVSAVRRELRVRGLDAVDGTPVLDLKPVLVELLPTDVRQPEWAGILMRDYFRPQP